MFTWGFPPLSIGIGNIKLKKKKKKKLKLFADQFFTIYIFGIA